MLLFSEPFRVVTLELEQFLKTRLAIQLAFKRSVATCAANLNQYDRQNVHNGRYGPAEAQFFLALYTSEPRLAISEATTSSSQFVQQVN